MEAINQLDPREADELLHSWDFIGRDDQQPPAGDWMYWLLLAGRGFGKTRTGAEWIRSRAKMGYGRMALVAPTAGDARDTMVEGESGLLAICWENDRTAKGAHLGRPLYEPSKRRVTWANGAQCTLFSAEEPERLRGPQHDGAWADELAAWQYMEETWDMLLFGLRLGLNPQVVVTTTPKPRKLLKSLVVDKSCIVTRGNTFMNASNLAPRFLAELKKKYDGTRMGRQELYAELLEEAEGALWTRLMIERNRITADKLPGFKRKVVSIDPATTNNSESDETGLGVQGLGLDDIGYQLVDASGRYTPDGWANAAIELFNQHDCDRIVAEANQGGDMVKSVIRAQPGGKNIPVHLVYASKSKRARAEPISTLSEQDRIKFVGGFSQLEDQLVTWEPLGSLDSPDRLDMMVWGFTDLMIRPNVSETAVAPRSTGGGVFTNENH